MLVDANFDSRSCACKITSKIERLQAPTLSDNRRSVPRHSPQAPQVYLDNLPSSNQQIPSLDHLVIPPRIVQTRAMLLVGWGKIHHNRRGGSVHSIKLPNSLQRAVLVLFPSLNNNNSRVAACSGTLGRLGLKIN